VLGGRWLRGAIEPVSRRRWINRWTHARLTPNVAATSSASPLTSHARATRSRRSIEYGAITTSAREEYHDSRTKYKSKNALRQEHCPLNVLTASYPTAEVETAGLLADRARNRRTVMPDDDDDHVGARLIEEAVATTQHHRTIAGGMAPVENRPANVAVPSSPARPPVAFKVSDSSGMTHQTLYASPGTSPDVWITQVIPLLLRTSCATPTTMLGPKTLTGAKS